MTINKKPLDAEAGELDGTQGGTKQQRHITSFRPFFQPHSWFSFHAIGVGPYVSGDKGGVE